MERTYDTISEQTARTVKQINSFDDYVAGSATAEYKRYVDRIMLLWIGSKKQSPI